MIKEIKYNGYSASPSDYECLDGDLSLSMGAIQEDGAIKPVLPPSLELQLEQGESVKFIHKTASFTNYIVCTENINKALYINSRTKERHDIGLLIGTLTHFNAIGNTLLAFTDAGIYYYLWVGNGYKSLGNHIPDVEISFGLVGHPRLFSLSDESKSTFNIEFDRISMHKLFDEFSENNKTRITEQIMSKMNKFVAQETINKGRFCFPFFVRYALRLYDGSLVCHSAPILMNPSTKAAPIVLWKRANGEEGYTSAECDIMLVASTLDYRVIRNTDSYILKDWSDIVKSIDVFISKPIYTYDQDGKITSFEDADNYTTKFIGRLHADNPTTDNNTLAEDKLIGQFVSKDFLNYYCEWEYSRIYSMYYSENREYPSTTFHLPEFPDKKVREALQNTSSFYKLCSIEVSEAIETNQRKNIIVDNDFLKSLVNREVMTDDYLTHDTLYADYSFVYNNRINLSGLRRKPFDGFLAQSMFAYCNQKFNWKKNGSILDIQVSHIHIDDYTIEVYIKENGENYKVTSRTHYNDAYELVLFNSVELQVTENGITSTRMSKSSFGCYMFYPNANAYKMVIYNHAQPCYMVDLKPHEFLNGAYALLDYDLVREKNFTSLPDIQGPILPIGPEASFPIPVPNKIYTSEVNNPFYYPVLGINAVGTGRILGICAAAKALSEGQFGQFPLYAFTTEGVWALEVSNTGTYSAKQPITRDVCINADSITQIDTAVLFATDKGIMYISGSTVQCISDALNAKDIFSITELPKPNAIIEIYNKKTDDSEKISIDDITILPFRDFLKNCRMIYDYANQRIIIYNTTALYAYIYSLKSKTFGMMRSDITHSVNSYPDALAMCKEEKMVNFSVPIEKKTTSLIITRPFKIDDPNIFKTLNTIIQRGMFHSGHVSQILYGSNDLYHWHTIWSSVDKIMRGFSGTPYKAFRLALICEFEHTESLYGCTISYGHKMNNQIR